MHFNEYLRSHIGYFWQWEDSLEVIAIPKGNTIAYSAYIHEILENLAPQGLPPFGSLLLVIAATNPNGHNSLRTIHDIMSKVNYEEVDDAIKLLTLLLEVPSEYKKGKKRMLLLQSLFENCHQILSLDNSKQIVDWNALSAHDKRHLVNKVDFSPQNFNRDFRTIRLILRKYESAEDIIAQIAAIPDLEEELILKDPSESKDDPKEIVEALIDNYKTFQVGALVKRIWTGLNLPVTNALPSQQPLGGVSDLTNKGDFDKLLISEFANDDLVLLSRLANNEALYLNREIPPSTHNLYRTILIDVSLTNWGTPKTIAFATMLAIAKHPKTNIDCEVFALGDTYHPIEIDTVDDIIAGLQILDSSLNGAIGMSAFFRDHPAKPDREVFVISEASTIKHPAVLHAMHEHHNAIHYWISCNAEGQLDLYKRQQRGKRHIQHLELPLHELWSRAPKKHRDPTELSSINYPILFSNDHNIKKFLRSPDGEYYQIRKEGFLMRFYDKNVHFYEKGWELVLGRLRPVTAEFELGKSANGDLILLSFTAQQKELTMLNIDTGEEKKIQFKQWKGTAHCSFVFEEGLFHHVNLTKGWTIDLDGQVETGSSLSLDAFKKKDDELEELSRLYLGSSNLFKNIKEIFITDQRRLVFNIHELVLTDSGHIKLNVTREPHKIAEASLTGANEFSFDDGSIIEIDRCGMLIFKSANIDISTFYIPSMLNTSLGAATEDTFAGSDYYLREPEFKIILQSIGAQPLAAVKLIKEHTGLGLKKAKLAVDSAPYPILRHGSWGQATDIKQALSAIGCKIQIHPENEWSASRKTMNSSTTSGFFETYIHPFIDNIV